MANSLFDGGRNAFLKGEIDWTNNTVQCTLVIGYMDSETGLPMTPPGGDAVVSMVIRFGPYFPVFRL